MVRLFQAPLRWPQGRVGLPLPLHPSRRHLQPPADRRRRAEHHLQGQGLPGRGARTLHHHEFIRRFLLHVLPKGFHRIRHYGLLASAAKAEMVAKARELLSVPATEPDEDVATDHVQHCPCCGGRMHVIETFAPGTHPSYCAPAPVGAIRIDTS